MQATFFLAHVQNNNSTHALQARDTTPGGAAATARFHQHMLSLGAEEGATEVETFAR
jgi:hypothetical protein